MKKYFFAFVALFFAACVHTSSEFVNVSLPSFKPQEQAQVDVPSSGIRVAVRALEVEQNNNYSDDFENSILRIRMQKEAELLKQNLEEQMRVVVGLKGYELSEGVADYNLVGLIKIYIDEKEAKRADEWLSGSYVASKLGLKFEARLDFIDAHNPQNVTNITSNTKLDSWIDINYPVKSDGGLGPFKTTLSTVPTQINKGLERPAFEIDKAFIAFYKNTLNSLNAHLPAAENMQKTNADYNEFKGGVDGDGVEIFE
ncbi:hypothetical protein [Campylobacter sp.]|uniref:hypothetical protein n=1 Tax=Campylobacter sp. TaxID=205 RepID=UPI0026DB7931|nr:hypothetical protein [Campylobacter sp.]MDO4673619.1 hypothetical protein [Campylobacter sp.]